MQQFTQQHYSQSYCSITHVHTATSHLVTHKRHALIQAAADLRLFMQQHLYSSITATYTATLHLVTQPHYTYLHSSICPQTDPAASHICTQQHTLNYCP